MRKPNYGLSVLSGKPHASDILFVGYQSNPFKYVAKSDVYALCSITEGFPNSLIEAMISGTPVVATNCMSGPSEILLHRNNSKVKCEEFVLVDYGILTPTFSESIDLNLKNKSKEHYIYADALELIIKNAELKKIYKKKGFKRANQFDEVEIIKQYISLIESS